VYDGARWDALEGEASSRGALVTSFDAAVGEAEEELAIDARHRCHARVEATVGVLPFPLGVEASDLITAGDKEALAVSSQDASLAEVAVRAIVDVITHAIGGKDDAGVLESEEIGDGAELIDEEPAMGGEIPELEVAVEAT